MNPHSSREVTLALNMTVLFSEENKYLAKPSVGVFISTVLSFALGIKMLSAIIISPIGPHAVRPCKQDPVPLGWVASSYHHFFFFCGIYHGELDVCNPTTGYK